MFKKKKPFLPQPSGPSAWRQAVKTTVKPCLKIFKLYLDLVITRKVMIEMLPVGLAETRKQVGEGRIVLNGDIHLLMFFITQGINSKKF